MRKFCCILLAAVLLAGCREKAEVIPMEEMKSLLYDMYMIDAYLEYDEETRASSDSLSVYLPIIEKYGYDRDLFENSLRYYIGHDKDISDIIKAVRQRMRDRVSELDEAMNNEKTEKMREIDDQQDSAGIEKGILDRRKADRQVFEQTLKKEKIVEGKEKEEGGEV